MPCMLAFLIVYDSYNNNNNNNNDNNNNNTNTAFCISLCSHSARNVQKNSVTFV